MYMRYVVLYVLIFVYLKWALVLDFCDMAKWEERDMGKMRVTQRVHEQAGGQ